MRADLWPRVEALYNELVEASPAEQRRRLDAIGDGELRAEVESLLSAGSLNTDYSRAVGDLAAESSAAAQRFGPWRVTGVLGHGGMGAVYEAVRDDGAFSKTVAIKVLHAGKDTPLARERFRQEREILAGLDHPNVARLIDGGETPEGLAYIVMECVVGRPVTQLCQDSGASVERRLRLFLKICSAVEYAHRNLVIHRDLKPGNILVDGHGEPKLLDFGIAKLLDHSATLTLTGWQGLTPAYASPEQVSGKPVTTATDIYSLGMVLYQMLTGRQAYELTNTSSPFLIAQTICETPPLPPGIGEDLDNILLMALRKEPERRYLSASAFAADIENYLASRPVAAREDTLWYRTRRFARRHWVGMAVGFALLAVLTGGIVVSQYQARRAQRRFAEVRGLANEFLDRFDERLSHMRGSTEARRELVQTVLKYLEKLAQDSGGDPGLQMELAAAYLKVGELQYQLASPEVGAASIRRALSLAERLQKEGNGGVGVTGIIAQGRASLGVYHFVHGEVAKARELYGSGIEVAKKAPNPDAYLYRALANLQRRLGRLESENGNVAAGTAFNEEAVRNAEKSIAMETGDAASSALVTAQLYLGRGVKLRGDLERAKLLSSQAAKLAYDAYLRDPGSVVYRTRLLEAYLGAAEGYAVPFDVPGGIVPPERVEKAIELAESLVAEDPRHNSLKLWLLIAYSQRGMFLDMPPEKGTAALRKALVIAEELCKSDPSSTLYVGNRGLVRIGLANWLRLAGKHVEAVEHATLAYRDLETRMSDRESRAAMIAIVLLMGDLLQDEKDFAGAAQRYEQGRKAAQELFDADRSDMRMAAFLAMLIEGQGRNAMARGNAVEATQSFERAAAIWRAWPKQTTDSSYNRRHLEQAEALLAKARRR